MIDYFAAFALMPDPGPPTPKAPAPAVAPAPPGYRLMHPTFVRPAPEPPPAAPSPPASAAAPAHEARPAPSSPALAPAPVSHPAPAVAPVPQPPGWHMTSGYGWLWGVRYGDRIYPVAQPVYRQQPCPSGSCPRR
jgi:hypothetical protein